MKIFVTLSNSGGEIGRERVWATDANSPELSTAIHDALADWTLAIGDIIRVIEEEG
jgi:hypothetical protein